LRSAHAVRTQILDEVGKQFFDLDVWKKTAWKFDRDRRRNG